MFAPRALARSYSSITRTPAPSPRTKPSRSLSQGRLAFSGSSLRVDSARMDAKPATVTGDVACSAPPTTITSASPYWIMRIPKPMLWVPVVQAVTTAMFGPRNP